MSSKEQKRTYPEDGEEECALTRTKAKKSRTCEKFPPFSLLLKLWVLKNYEYSPGSGYISLSSIISDVQSDKEMLQQNEGKPLTKTQIHVKPTIHKLWGRKVITTNHRFEKDGKKVRAFKNLRKKGDSSAAGFDSEGSAGEHVIMVPGWQVVINNDKSLSILRVEDWLLDGQRVVTEIRADQGQDSTWYNCSISAHGCKLDISDLGFKIGQLSSPKEELELLAKCISGTQLCKGFSLPDPSFSTHSTFKVAEYSNASDTNASETRIFSSSCQIFRCRRLFCPECLHCKKVLFQKKERERRRLGKINKHTNHRFMTREQLESKLKEMQKELINYKMKVKQLENRDEEEDNDDDCDVDDGDDDDGDVDDDDDDGGDVGDDDGDGDGDDDGDEDDDGDDDDDDNDDEDGDGDNDDDDDSDSADDDNNNT